MQNVFSNRSLNSIALLAAAAIIGFVSAEFRTTQRNLESQEAIEKWQGLSRQGTDRILRSPLTFSDVDEGEFDANNDGEIDLRTVTILDGTPYRCEYLASHMTELGLPRRIIVNLGPNSTYVAAAYSEDASRPIKLTLSIENTMNSSEIYAYEDLDMNGTLDKMSTFVDDNLVQTFLLYENTWKATSKRQKSSTDFESLIDSGGKLITVEFQNGAWQPAIKNSQ